MTRAELKRALDEMDPAERRKLLAELDEGTADNMVPSERMTEQDERRLGRAARDSRLGYDQTPVLLACDAMPSTPEGQAQWRRAERVCKPIIGEDACLAHDSAESMLRATGAALGIDAARSVHRSALPALLDAAFRAQRQPAKASPVGLFRPVLAADRGDNFAKRFPNVARVRAA